MYNNNYYSSILNTIMCESTVQKYLMSAIMYMHDVVAYNLQLTDNLSSSTSVYGFKFSFLFLMYSLGLRTLRQSKNLSIVLTNRSVSVVSGFHRTLRR